MVSKRFLQLVLLLKMLKCYQEWPKEVHVRYIKAYVSNTNTEVLLYITAHVLVK